MASYLTKYYHSHHAPYVAHAAKGGGASASPRLVSNFDIHFPWQLAVLNIFLYFQIFYCTGDRDKNFDTDLPWQIAVLNILIRTFDTDLFEINFDTDEPW